MSPRLSPEHEAYHVDHDYDDAGNAVATHGSNKDCPYCNGEEEPDESVPSGRILLGLAALY